MKYRYFFFGYIADNRHQHANGNMSMACDVFPSRKIIKTKACEQLHANGFITFKPDDIIITSVFEFNDKNDFETFVNEDVTVTITPPLANLDG